MAAIGSAYRLVEAADLLVLKADPAIVAGMEWAVIKLLRDLLGEWCFGRLEPRRFAILYATIIGSLAALIVLTIAWAVTMAKASGAGWPAGLIFFTFMALLAALFNITVKRGRDMGIPGFVMGIGFVVLFCMGGVTIFLSILLALVPSGTFARSDPSVAA